MGKSHSSNKEKRDASITYRNKCVQIEKWYTHLLKCRKDPKGNNLINPNTKEEPKRKELKDLQFYIDKIKKVNN